MFDMMIDLETLGRKAGCVVLSIGAVLFDPRGNGYGEKFYYNIDRLSCQKYGLIEEPGTVSWWSKQSLQAKHALTVNPAPLENVVYNLNEFFHRNNVVKIWCQGAAFDVPIISALYDKLQIQTPWEFWNVRDTRTLYDACNFDPYTVKRQGTYHNAVDDCIHQILCVQTAINQRGKIIDQSSDRIQ